MARSFNTPIIVNPANANSSGLQLAKLIAGGAPTVSSPIGVDASGNVVISGYSSPQTVTVEFTTPLPAYTFIMASGGAKMGMTVSCTLSGTFESGAFPDEYEMEPMAAYGWVYATNWIFFTVTCTDSTILTLGKKTIIYTLS